MRTILETPPIPRIVPEDVFDAFGWCPSRQLEWRCPPGWSPGGRVTADNPPRMVFVLKQELPFLPRELAWLHAPGLGLLDEWALAPYGIDDATDGLYEHRVPPDAALWLAAASLPALFWGLHDWAHFHNHGPLTQRALTELQCDASALSWLWRNRAAIGLNEGRWEGARTDVERITIARYADERMSFDPALLGPDRLREWAETPPSPRV